LERAFEESEVFEVVKALNDNKPQTLTVFLWLSFNLVRGFLKKMSRASFISSMLGISLKGASMPRLLPLFPRKLEWWISRIFVL
jgi:hypothetical protein